MPAHLNLLDLVTLTILGERDTLWSSSLWKLLHSPFSSLLGPKSRFKILFSNTLSLHSSLSARDHASHPYSTTGNIIVIYILTFNLIREKSRRQKCLDCIITWISCFKSTSNFLLNRLKHFTQIKWCPKLVCAKQQTLRINNKVEDNLVLDVGMIEGTEKFTYSLALSVL
jgi:hypothetical protein